MSQVAIIDIEGNNPQIPTQFDADIGSAVPIANILNILGDFVIAGSDPVFTTGSGNTITVNVQISQAIAASNAQNIGLAAFNSAQFTVDAAGFVSLIGGGVAIDQIQVQANTAPGVNPVDPTAAGLMTVNGLLVAAHNIPIETRSRALNTWNIEPQISSAVPGSSLASNGMSHFNSSHFSVDGTGFVSLVGGGQAIDQIAVQANTAPGVNPVNPDATGLITVNGNLVVAHSVPIETRSRALNAYNIEPQISSATAATTLSANGMSHFDSARFTVDANGFVSTVGTGILLTLTPDEDFDGSAATPIAPQAGTIIVSGSTLAAAIVTETYNSNGLSTGNLEIEHRAWLTPFVVDSSTTPGARGTFSTIQAAINAASSGDTVAIRARATAYVEDLTLKAGVNLSSFACNAYNNVIISGNCTLSSAGTVACSGIVFQTNSANCITVSGSAASVLRLKNCNIQATNNSAISFTSSSSSSEIDLTDCTGNLATAGINLFTKSGAGGLTIFNSRFANGGGSTTASTVSAGTCNFQYSEFDFPITTSGTSVFGSRANSYLTETQNVTALTLGGSGAHFSDLDYIAGGTATALSVGNTSTISGNVISSSNTNAIAGAGTLVYSGLSFSGSSGNISTTTQTLNFEGPSKKIGSSNSGNTNTLTVTNTSNTATSAANIVSTVGGGTAADATYQAVVSGVTTWTWGIDNSDSDSWVLAASTALGTTNVMHVLTSGEINFPLQSAFLATANSQADVTGDATNYSVLFANEIFDQNNDFASSTYTCPVTSRVHLNATISASGLAAGNTSGSWLIQTSNRNYIFSQLSWGVVMNVGTTVNQTGSVLADMDAADVANVICQVSGGTKVVDINATQTFFSGYIEA